MYKILGTTEEITTCEQCGKPNLKKTVALETETGAVVHYGTDCAAAAITGTKKNGKVVLAQGNAVAYAEKWIGRADPRNIANYIGVHFTNAWTTAAGAVKIQTLTGIIEVKQEGK